MAAPRALLAGRRRQVARMAFGSGLDVGPRARARGPDMRGDLQAARIVERAGPHHDESDPRVAVAVDRRAAGRAEVPAQRAAALRGRIVVAPRLALGNAECVLGHYGVDRAAAARGSLAVAAMAGAQRRDRRRDRIADGAAEAPAGQGRGHQLPTFRMTSQRSARGARRLTTETPMK